MRPLILALSLCLALPCAFAEPFDVGPVKLTADAEHYGAYLDKNVNLSFYPTGELLSGFLKADYVDLKGASYPMGSSISFFRDGTVSLGTLKNPYRSGNFEYAPGPVEFWQGGLVRKGRANNPAHQNIAYAGQADITVNKDGTLSTIQAVSGPPLRLLNRTLQLQAVLQFDEASKAYRLVKGITSGNDVLVALFPTSRPSSNQLAGTAIPVIVPKSTTFELPEFNGKNYEAWRVNNQGLPFSFNGWNFGTNPVLIVRDMQLIGVQVSQAVKLGEYQYQPLDIVYFDATGKIVARQP
jgi:hypothetical protein